MSSKFQTATHENCAAISCCGETSNLFNTSFHGVDSRGLRGFRFYLYKGNPVYVVVGALYSTQPENQTKFYNVTICMIQPNVSNLDSMPTVIRKACTKVSRDILKIQIDVLHVSIAQSQLCWFQIFKQVKMSEDFKNIHNI